MKTTQTNWSAVARDIGPQFAANAAQHDRDGTFVADNYELLKQHRMISAAVPAELGGGGAQIDELCGMLRVLAHYCPSTALSLSMHTHLLAAAVWKWNQGQPAEALLRRVAAEQLVLVSTGATDWVQSNGVMDRVEGGFRVSAWKVFASGSPVADMLITSAQYDDPDEGDLVLHFPVPFSADGVTILNDWDTLGMRATGSHTVVFDNVFVPDSAIGLRRQRNEWHTAWSVALAVAPPLYMSPYVGLAERAVEVATGIALGKRERPFLPYIVGEMENQLAIVRLAWRDMIANAAEYDFAATIQTANRALIHKTICANAAIATVEKAMEASGGRGFFRRSELERLLRDVHAAPYHPLPEKRQLAFTGQLALGIDPVAG